MNQLTVRKTAIMVDGGYYRKRAIYLWGKEISAVDRANELFNYCLLHLSEPPSNYLYDYPLSNTL